jgi:hypothetical protein
MGVCADAQAHEGSMAGRIPLQFDAFKRAQPAAYGESALILKAIDQIFRT